MRLAAADAGNGAVFSKQEHNSKDDEQIGDHIVQDISLLPGIMPAIRGRTSPEDQIVEILAKGDCTKIEYSIAI